MSLVAKKIQAAGAAVITLIVSGLMMLLIVTNFAFSEQNRELKLLSRFTSLIVNDVAQSLRTLNNLENKQCTPDLLMRM